MSRNEVEGRLQEARETPRWSVFIPLFVVVAALVALVAVPLWIAEETRVLREELRRLHDPLSLRVASLERATGAELAAARAWALTGDPFFVDRFLSVHGYGDRLAADIDSLASELGGPVRVASDGLLRTRDFWVAANFGRTRDDFREGIAEHEQHFDAVMVASQRLRNEIDREVNAQNRRIARAERVRGRLTAFLALVALLGAASALWLARRLLRKDAELQLAAAELRDVNETLEERVRERTRRARHLSRELTLAEQRERRQLAQILHDDLQQYLFALQLNVGALEDEAGTLPEDVLRRQLSRNSNIIEEAIAATRRLTVDLSPPIEAGDSLLDVLSWLASHVRERFGLAVEVRAEAEPSVPTEELRLLVFQIVRELLFNVVKHAGTDSAVIEVSNRDGQLVVEVVDAGRGFDPASVDLRGRTTAGGFGLRRARERISLFGGQIELESVPGAGTRARVVVPLEPPDR